MYRRGSRQHSEWAGSIFGNKELRIWFHFHFRNIVALVVAALELTIGEAVAM